MASAIQLREEALAKLHEAKSFAEEAGLDKEGGELDPEKQSIFDAKMGEFRDLDAKAQKAAANGDNVGTLKDRMEWYAGKVSGGPVPFTAKQIQSNPNAGKTMGAAFVDSKEYADLLASGNLQSDRSSFRSTPFQAAATDVINTTPSTGNATGLVTPEYLPGILPLPQRELTVRGLFGQGTTSSDTVSYAQQTAFDKATGLAVKQTVDPEHVSIGLKKQSSISWERVTSPVETIATWMAATRQTLADAGQIRSLIDNQLRLMLQLEEEDQLLNGNGTSPNLSGIYDQPIQTSTANGTSDGDPNIDAIRNAKRLVKVGLSRLSADAIVMNPTDSMYLDLTTDGEGRYRIGDPFGGGVGEGPRPIWSLRRVESEAIEEGHALIGAFRSGATVLERQGITILTADQHADFFVRNLVVVLAEERLGFPVFFPSAFVDLTLDAWPNVIGS